MANEMTWRKMPRGIIRDEEFDLISDALPDALKAAPYMFYMTALCKADDDGIFDLEDGVIFSRLMRIGSPEDVMRIANMMMKRHIILRAGTSTKCMLTDWEYSIKEKPRTMEDRRKIVAKQIEAEREAKSKAVPFTAADQKDELPISVDFSVTPSSDDFFCPVNDNKAENVAKEKIGDKNAENVVKETETEKIREREQIDREIRTHIEQKDKNEKEVLQANGESLTHQEIDDQEKLEHEEIETEDDAAVTDGEALADLALSMTQGNKSGEELHKAWVVFRDFFAKNCLGFNPNLENENLMALANRAVSLATDRNPAGIVASVFCSQFKNLIETSDYYRTYPITPAELLKPGAYSHVLAAASRILLPKDDDKEAWIIELERQNAEIQAEKNVCDAFHESMQQYGIDPSDPNALHELIRVKAAEQHKENTPP